MHESSVFIPQQQVVHLFLKAANAELGSQDGFGAHELFVPVPQDLQPGGAN
jgi:hypothetical protein